MNDWEIIEFESKDKIGGISDPTIRITLRHRESAQEVLVTLQKQTWARIEKGKDGKEVRRILKDTHYTLIGAMDKLKFVSPKAMTDLGIDIRTLLTISNLTVTED